MFFKKLVIFFTTFNDGKSKSWHESIIKDVRNLFRLEKLKTQTTDTTIERIWNLFRLEKENEEIKDE